MTRVKQGIRYCWKCTKNTTYRRIDGVPICDKCLLSDARNGKVKDYSKMKKPQKVINKENEKEIALKIREREVVKKERALVARERKLTKKATKK